MDRLWRCFPGTGQSLLTLKRILADTGFWYALFEERDAHYKRANKIFNKYKLESKEIVYPWPILYETLNTRFMNRSIALTGFEKLIRNANALILEDQQYRNIALESVLSSEAKNENYKNMSLVDAVINEILLDSSARIGSLITFNAPDFSKTCYQSGIQIIS